MVAPELGILSIGAEYRDFILDLNHQDRVVLGVDLSDVPHESRERLDLPVDDCIRVVGSDIVVADSVRIYGARIGFGIKGKPCFKRA